MSETISKKRSAAGAFFLSLFFSGLGQIYNGKLKRGILILAAEILLTISGFLFLFGSFTGLVIYLILALLFKLACATDAAMIAKRSADYYLKKYNRWYYYLVYICLLYLGSELLMNYIVPDLNYRSFVVPTGAMENTILSGDYLCVEKTNSKANPPKKGDIIVFEFPGNRDELEAREFQYFIKRCIATAGDTLQIKDKKVFVNGMESKLPEFGKFNSEVLETKYDQYRTFPVGRGFTPNNYGPLRIPRKGDTIFLNSGNFKEWEIFIKREKHQFRIDANEILLDGKPAKFYVVERDYCFGMGDNRDNSLDSRYFGFIPVENVYGKPLYVYLSLSDNNSEKINDNSYIRWKRIGTLIK